LPENRYRLLNEKLIKQLEETEFRLWIEEEIQIQKEKDSIINIYKEFLKGKIFSI
jgi:hypothetical protein